MGIDFSIQQQWRRKQNKKVSPSGSDAYEQYFNVVGEENGYISINYDLYNNKIKVQFKGGNLRELISI